MKKESGVPFGTPDSCKRLVQAPSIVDYALDAEGIQCIHDAIGSAACSGDIGCLAIGRVCLGAVGATKHAHAKGLITPNEY